ncbi:MAG: endonuclease NucS [Nanoarchaeota archaeon]|nr:endonuclease NucS [Nanoarchaeota archaeon]
MSLADFKTWLPGALQRNETIIFGARCEIAYSGRAESHLHLGDRIIIIKADKTLLAHQPEGNNPVNHMREGAHHTLEGEGPLLLKSENPKLKEYLYTTITHIHFYHGHTMEDGQKVHTKGTEEDMSDMIFTNPQLIEEGFKPLSREEHTQYGFIDVFGHDKDNILVIIECKRQNADPKAVEQLKRYVEKMKLTKGLKHIRGILASPSISTNAEHMLKAYGYEWKRIQPPNYLEKYDKAQQQLNNY